MEQNIFKQNNLYFVSESEILYHLHPQMKLKFTETAW